MFDGPAGVVVRYDPKQEEGLKLGRRNASENRAKDTGNQFQKGAAPNNKRRESSLGGAGRMSINGPANNVVAEQNAMKNTTESIKNLIGNSPFGNAVSNSKIDKMKAEY